MPNAAQGCHISGPQPSASACWSAPTARVVPAACSCCSARPPRRATRSPVTRSGGVVCWRRLSSKSPSWVQHGDLAPSLPSSAGLSASCFCPFWRGPAQRVAGVPAVAARVSLVYSSFAPLTGAPFCLGHYPWAFPLTYASLIGTAVSASKAAQFSSSANQILTIPAHPSVPVCIYPP